jgi:anti-sigma factor RsiW
MTTHPITAMTLDRLRTLLDAYGAGPAHWPDAEREAALALIARSPEARAAVEAARALDALIDRWPNPAADAINPLQLVAAVTAQPQRPAGRAKAEQAGRITIGWPNFAGLAAAAIAGFLVGWSGLGPEPPHAPPAQGEPTQALFGDAPEDWTW